MPQEKKVVLITGATAGIGRDAALYLAGRGHRVIASGRSETALARLVLGAGGNSIETLKLDVTDPASIAAAVATVDQRTGTILVRALFDNKDEKLWPGTLANVRVLLHIDKQAVTVPNEAVQNGQRGDFVFIIENGVAKVREVTVARVVDGDSIITSGLSGNETVVTDGQLSLRNNSPVDIKRQAEAVQ